MSTWEGPRDRVKKAEQSYPAGTPLCPPPTLRKQSDLTLAGTLGRRTGGGRGTSVGGLSTLVPSLLALTAVH